MNACPGACTDFDQKCGKKRGWKQTDCANEYLNIVREGCPKMCNMCGKLARVLLINVVIHFCSLTRVSTNSGADERNRPTRNHLNSQIERG